jgi:cell division protein FtsI (penicillin-binding protein 3)
VIRGRAEAPKRLALSGATWRVEGDAPEPDGVVRARSAMRVLWTGGLVGAGYVLLGLQASSLMLFPDAQIANKARVQFEESVEIRGPRGSLVDRNGIPMAESVTMYALHADPSRLDAAGAEALAHELAAHLSLDAAALTERLRRSDRRDVLIARDLEPGQAFALASVRSRGILWAAEEEQRYYPGRTDAAQLLGVVGRDGVGQAGLERLLDRDLRGDVVKYVQFRDRKGRRITTNVPVADRGHDVTLTIDRRIQRLAEEALDEAMIRTRAEAAHVTVLDVRTGEILALASQPSANPNHTAALDLANLKNRAAMDAYEPGSVFKPFIAAAALDGGFVTPDTIVDCEGGAWAVGRNVIHDDHPKGAITVAEVIKYSSNIGAAKLAFTMGAEATLKALTDFGFGRSTELDLPGETPGVLRRAKGIKPIELATTAYGHGVSVTNVQLAVAMATLGNGGVRMEPMLVRQVRDARGEILSQREPKADRRVVSAETARAIVSMMIGVTEQGGTGTRARVDGYTVAGKTGTAWKHEGGQYSATERIGSFVGIVPAEAPVLAISVAIDSPQEGSKYGGIVAAPVFSSIASGALRILGVPATPDPNEITGEPTLAAIPTAPPELVVVEPGLYRAPDLSGLSYRDALATLEGAGLAVNVRGSGRVAAQLPLPGDPLPSGHSIDVVLQ